MADREGDGSGEGAELHLVSIARVEKGDGASLVEPTLQLLGRQPRRCMSSRVDPFHAKGDDLVLEFDEHAVEGLLVTLAQLGLQGLQSRDGSDRAN